MYAAEVKADSINPHTGQRIITVVATYPRFVHSEFMTHRVFSRNAASSRAIPVKTLMQRIKDDPVIPVEWGKNQKGMQAGETVDERTVEFADLIWRDALQCMMSHASQLADAGIHKQIVNRLLEPWAWMTTIITGTEWDNFFRLRCHPDAQPELQRMAFMVRDAIEASTPVSRALHVPFSDHIPGSYNWKERFEIATARVARISYLTHDGIRDLSQDRRLHGDLLRDKHMSPFEHCSFAMGRYGSCGNFRDWCQYRHLVDLGENWRHADHQALGAAHLTD